MASEVVALSKFDIQKKLNFAVEPSKWLRVITV